MPSRVALLSLFPNDQYSGLFSHVFSFQNSETCVAAQSTNDFSLPMKILGDWLLIYTGKVRAQYSVNPLNKIFTLQEIPLHCFQCNIFELVRFHLLCYLLKALLLHHSFFICNVRNDLPCCLQSKTSSWKWFQYNNIKQQWQELNTSWAQCVNPQLAT